MRGRLRNSSLPESCLEYPNPRNPQGYIASLHSHSSSSPPLPPAPIFLCLAVLTTILDIPPPPPLLPSSPPSLLFISSHSSPPSHISTTHVYTRGCSKLALSSQNAMAPSLFICTLHSPSTRSASPMASAEYLTHSTQSERHFISQSCDHHPITFLQFGPVT